MPRPAYRSRRCAERSVRGGGTLACPTCGREEFALQGAAILDDHRQYGSRRLRRVQLVCENCAFVLSFDADRLRAGATTGATTTEEP